MPKIKAVVKIQVRNSKHHSSTATLTTTTTEYTMTAATQSQTRHLQKEAFRWYRLLRSKSRQQNIISSLLPSKVIVIFSKISVRLRRRVGVPRSKKKLEMTIKFKMRKRRSIIKRNLTIKKATVTFTEWKEGQSSFAA